MFRGGPQSVLLGALLLTVGIVPITAGQETCAGAGPAELCIDDPLVHDAGEARAVDGDVSAAANGGLATGTGTATFVVDYLLEDQTIGPGEEVRMSVQLVVHDNEGNPIDWNGTVERLTAPGSQDGEIQASIDTVGPELQGGTVRVETSATVFSNGNSTQLGDAVSVSPITVVVTPPTDVAERTNAGETQVGTFDVTPTQDEASLVDGELFVADGTSIRLEATGEVTTKSVDDVSYFTQRASARLVADVGTDTYSVSVFPVLDSCNDACSTDAKTVEIELSLVLPGDAEEAYSDLDLRLDAEWYLRTPHPEGWGSQTETNGVLERGSNEIVAAGP